MDAGGKEGACAEVKGEGVKGVCSTANFYHLFNLLLRVICQTVAAVPAPPSLVHSNEQPGKNLSPFQRISKEEELMIMVLRSEAIMHGSLPRTQSVCTLCTQEMRLINICSQGQRKDLPHDDGETRIFAACFLRQVAGQYLSNMLGDCLHKTPSEIGGSVAPPKNEDLGLV